MAFRHSRRLPFFAALVVAAAVIAAPSPAFTCGGHAPDGPELLQRRLDVVVATDQAWRQAKGAHAGADVEALIRATNEILAPIRVRLTVVDRRTWITDEEDSMAGLLHTLDESVPAQRSEMVVGLTGHKLSTVDGIAHLGHVHLVVRPHDGHPERDAFVVAHEIGHLLGAEHDECDHAYQCVMMAKGFDLPARWCVHHALVANAGAAALTAGPLDAS